MEGIKGCGVGLRVEFLEDIYKHDIDFLEITPENWIDIPIRYRESFERAVSSFPIVAHGLSLSIGSVESLDFNYLKLLKKFLDRYDIRHYSEHLSFSSLDGRQSYELLPIPMSEKMAHIVAEKLKIASDFLEREVILENPTYYYMPYAEIEESDFINLVLEKSGARLLFDINNLYVNSENHAFDAWEFFLKLDRSRIAYYHIAGHLKREGKPIIDTHGMPICEETWKLIEQVLKEKKAPILLERDNNIPPLDELMPEIKRARALQENL